MKSFSECGFKLHIPRLEIVNGTNLKISFKFVYTDDIKVALVRTNFECRTCNKTIESLSAISPENKTHNISYKIAFDKKPIIKDSILKLYFVRDRDLICVTYGIEWINIIKLNFIKISNANEKDIKNVLKAFSKDVSKKVNIKKDNEKKLLKNDLSTESIPIKSNRNGVIKNEDGEYEVDSTWRSGIYSVDRYVSALNKEIYYLREAGGKKHKVNNGRFLKRLLDRYVYSFDLESELYISEDSPIKFISSSFDDISGSVMMCEDFQIIILLNDYVGETFSTAFISVEPWKLLKAIINRSAYGIDYSNRITKQLIKDGPNKETSSDISRIKKGQKIAKEYVRENPITVIWGPPGTGKTHTMAEIAIENLKSDKTVLVVSHSNVSVDGVASKIAQLLREGEDKEYLSKGKVLRYGFIHDEELSQDEEVSSFRYAVNKNKKLRDKLEQLTKEYEELKRKYGLKNSKIIDVNNSIKSIKRKIKTEEIETVHKAKIVATTISKVVVDGVFKNRKYDVVMFDEVSMAYVMQIVAASSYAKEKLICVGDFMQLAPISQSPAQNVLSDDIFTYLGISKNGQINYHTWLVLLDEQRRMYPDISRFSNTYVYERLLKDHPCVVENNIDTVKEEPFENCAINLINMLGCYCAAGKNDDNSRFNILSGLITFASAMSCPKNKKVSIITPYAAQTRLVRALILDNKSERDLKCATVHQFQGSESDIVFFDAVESYPSKQPGWLMDKDLNAIKRLINVAVTRAKGKLVTVANGRFWNNYYQNKNTQHTFYKLLQYIEKNGTVISHVNDGTLENYVEHLNEVNGLDFYQDKTYREKFIEDIEKAKERIIISLPSGKLEKNFENELIEKFSRKRYQGIKVLIKCNDYPNLPDEWKKITRGTDDAYFPLTVIDGKVTWYGAPYAEWSFENKNSSYKTVCPIICRIEGHHTTEMIISLSSLEYIETDSGKSRLFEKNDKVVDTKCNGKEDSGLAEYLRERYKCSSCGKHMEFSKGKSGKFIMWCDNCKKSELIEPDEVNRYINYNYVKCPEHNADIKCRLSRYGLYVKCTKGHVLQLNEI